MFVRTKKGKILKCFKSENMNLPIYYVIGSKTNSYVEHQDVKKTSEDIIDILEAGDYVNGKEVTPLMLKMRDEQGIFGLPDHYKMFIEEIPIKSIVTKEQFESMQYKVD